MKKLTFLFILLLISTPAWAANKYLSASLGTRDWADSTGTWVTTSLGLVPAAAPTTSDVAIMEAGSGAVNVGTTGVASSISGVNYANTLTVTGTLTVNGSINIGTNATITGVGSGTLVAGASSTAGTWTIVPTVGCNFTEAGTGAKTLAADLTVTKLFSWTGVANHTGAFNVYVRGGWAGTQYFNDAVGNPTYYIQNGNVKDTLPNTVTGCIINPTVGDVTFEAGYPYHSSVREGTYLIYTASTYSVITTGSQVYFITFSGRLKCAGIHFESVFHVSGNPTLEEDWNMDYYDNNGIAVTYVGAYNINIYKDWNMRGACTYSGDATMKMVGTGTIGSDTTHNGSGFAGIPTININVVIDTSGTITGFPSRATYFGGSKSLTVTNGTFVTTGTLYYVNGPFTFNVPTLNYLNNTSTLSLPQNVTLSELTLEDGSSTSATLGLTTTTLRQNGTGTITVPNNGAILNVTTNLYQNGTDTKQPAIAANPIDLTDFATGGAVSMSNSSVASAYKRATFANQSLTDFTFSFDMLYQGQKDTAITQGNTGYIWFPSAQSSRCYVYNSASTAYYFTHGMTAGNKYRIVLLRTFGGAMRAYVNGVLKSVAVVSTPNGNNMQFKNFYWEVIGDVLIHNVDKGSAWVAADYALFVANGNSSDGQYDNTEPDLVMGFHTASWTPDVTGMKLKYDGTVDNEMIFRGNFRYVDATTSTNRIRTFFGSEIESLNVYPTTIPNIGGAGYSVTNS